MKKITNKKHFITGLISTVLAITCMIVSLLNVENLRYIIGAVLLVILAIISYYFAFSKKDISAEIAVCSDERDRHITMKSCQTMVRIMNYILFTVCQACLVLYGAFKLSAFLIVAITLSGVLILMFVVTLFTLSYYELHA